MENSKGKKQKNAVRFIVTPLLIFRQIYYIPTYDHISYEKGKKVYNFSDGGKIKTVLGNETQTKQNQKVYIVLDKALKISPMRNKSHDRWELEFIWKE